MVVMPMVSAKQARALTGLSHPTLWRMTKRKEFPQPKQLTPGRVAYLAEEVEAWLVEKGVSPRHAQAAILHVQTAQRTTNSTP
jgi:prophage regulatory protein